MAARLKDSPDLESSLHVQRPVSKRPGRSFGSDLPLSFPPRRSAAPAAPSVAAGPMTSGVVAARSASLRTPPSVRTPSLIPKAPQVPRFSIPAPRGAVFANNQFLLGIAAFLAVVVLVAYFYYR